MDSFGILREYLSRLLLQSENQDEEKEKSSNQVTLMTFHSAKGLEFPIVFMIGMDDGIFPHRRVLEEATDLSEERRLCYVGVTRAQEVLYLSRARNRIRYGKAIPQNPCRFIAEIPPEIILKTDYSSSPDLSSKEARDKHETKVTDFLSQIRMQLS